jgi:adenylate cyclase
MARRPWRRLWLVPSIGVFLGALGIAAWHPGERGRVGPSLEGRLLDLRFAVRGPLPAPDMVAIVAFDDLALAKLGAFPPARNDIATAVSQIFAAGARAVALDMLLVDTHADDGALVDALGLGPAVLGVAEAPVGAAPPSLRDTAGFAVLSGFRDGDPLPALAPAPGLQGHAALGHVTVLHEADGALRRMRPAYAVRTADGVAVLPGLAIAAASAAGRRPELTLSGAGAQGHLEGPWPSVPLDLQGALPLNYYGPAGTLVTLSAAALDGADLRDRVVFLGATAIGFGDRQATAFDATLPGVEAHATLAANLLDGKVLRRDAAAWAGSAVLALFAAMAGLASAGRGNPWSALLASLGTGALVVTALQGAFAAGWWLDATTVLSALTLGLGTGTAVQFFDHRRRATNLARYQSPRFVEALAGHVDPFGRNAPQAAIVLFVDVADFTTRAERIGPARTAEFLRGFHERVGAAADPLGGAVMNFAGDGVLVVFGLPEAASDDAQRALSFLAAVFAQTSDDGIALRAGGHAGPVTLSLLGGARQRTISVSGDVVNTASRLQAFAKTHGVSIALSAALIERERAARAWAETAGLTRLPDQQLRGRTATETIWIGNPPQKAGRARRVEGEAIT